MPGGEKKVRKLLPEPKPQPKEEVVLKSGIVFFSCFVSIKFTKNRPESLQKCLSLGFLLIGLPIYQNSFIIALKIGKAIISIAFLKRRQKFCERSQF